MAVSMIGAAQAAVVVQPVGYEIDGEPFEGALVYDDSVSGPRPGLVMVPNWLGVTDRAAEKAARAAGQKYVVFVADMYGKATRPADANEAKAAASAVRGDRPLMRKRAQAAVDVFREQAGEVLDEDRLAAIGFCFGGGSVLELARSGADLKAFVSFHGNLDTPNPDDAKAIKAPVLVLHGADDPSVPKEQVDAFIVEMQGAEDVDWQFVGYGGAVHSFTDPYANVPGRNEYNPTVARRAFAAMNDLLDEVFAAN
ncbi:dienelactone hydrolase family protein [Stutzerimonas azotifigens]|uniref:dienelactone hydrolase family protein n=1 Tax=Stutzerimonas azotifigens TaxID=291995 RepID=UPI000484E401